ncbi:MAG: radical SAM protein [Sphaerochaetaceae bacterium]|nr:radical SAM protein [Sphaerochaetaceae bacterium]
MNIAIVSCCLAKDDLSFPLGALSIETAIRQDSFLSINKIKLFNSFVASNPKKLARELVEENYKLVGLSVYLWNREWMDVLAFELKALDSEIVIFAGGTEVTANYTSFDLSFFRFLVLGEGEISTINAIKCLLKGEEINVNGVRCLENPTTISSFPFDLSTLASPFLTGVADFQIEKNRSILWEMTRGCPFRCNFCFESRGQRSVRSYPKERLEKELDYLIERNVEDVFVLDPTFNVNREETLSLLDMLIEKVPSYMHFSFEVRAELLDEALVQRFSNLFCSLQMGLQTTNQKAIELMNRSFKEKVFIENTDLLNNAQVEFGLDLIIGLPMDSLDGFKNSLDFALERKPSNIDIFLLAVLPGTVLFDKADEYNLVYDKKPPYLVKRTDTMNKEEISKALELKKSCDFFYNEGKACMWFHSLCDALEMKGSQVLEKFSEYYKSCDESDVFMVQDSFVRKILDEGKKIDCLKAVLSYMEIHQGLVFLQMDNEIPVVNLFYEPDEIALLDNLNIYSFVKKHRAFSKAKEYEIFYDEQGVLCIE